MAKVSVVVPNYNHRRFLRERLESIFAQSYQDFELILLDDASTDESPAILEEYAGKPRVAALLRSAVNSGSPFRQWDLGVSRASGDYVWIAESDDSCLPGLLEALAAELEADPRVCIAACRSTLIDEAGASVGDSANDLEEVLGSSRWRDSFRCSGEEECRRYLSICNSLPSASAVLFRRDVYQRIGGANTGLQLCGDWSTWIRILLSAPDARLAYLAEPLNRMRCHQATVRDRKRDRLLIESFTVLGDIEARIALTPEEREAALEARCRDWAWRTLKSILDPSAQQETLDAAFQRDPNAFARLARHVGIWGAEQSRAAEWLKKHLADRERDVEWLKDHLADRERDLAGLKDQLRSRNAKRSEGGSPLSSR